jgi:hypothetical protein
MKPNTFFKINSKRDLHLIYIDFKDKFQNSDLDSLIKIYDQGNNYCVCDRNSVISLTTKDMVDINPQLESIKNPYSENKTTVEKIEVNDAQEVSAEKNNTSERLKRINHILKTIQLDIEPEKLNKLISVIDLDNEYQGDTTINQIFNLQ